MAYQLTVGDTVWFIQWTKELGYHTVKTTIISIMPGYRDELLYSLRRENGNWYYSIHESAVYRNEGEAQSYCDNQNKQERRT